MNALIWSILHMIIFDTEFKIFISDILVRCQYVSPCSVLVDYWFGIMICFFNWTYPLTRNVAVIFTSHEFQKCSHPWGVFPGVKGVLVPAVLKYGADQVFFCTVHFLIQNIILMHCFCFVFLFFIHLYIRINNSTLSDSVLQY